MTNIYITNIEDNKINLNELISRIPQNVLKYAMKYNEEKTRKLSLTAWYILVKYLKEDFDIDIEKEKVYENSYHKPLINNIYFNISHSFQMSIVIISHKNCGIDIERLDDKVNHQDLSKRFFSKNEYQEYLNSDNKIETFIKEWTRKEAYFKYLGTGIKLSELNKEKEQVQSIESRLIHNDYGVNYYYTFITEEEVNNIKRIVL